METNASGDQSGASTGHSIALSLLEALDDEHRELHGGAGEKDEERIAYEQCRRQYGDNDSRTREAERIFRLKLFRRFHKEPRAALCFSGGGIRSATFGLGVMQALAAHSADTRQGGKSLLGEFDFLSTVSGGGYLGGWFSAWAARLEGTASFRAPGQTTPVPPCPEPPEGAPCGTTTVIGQLSASPESCFEPEPAPVRHLRSYSNYLSPKLGFLSGDTWALVATVARNMVLNWLVLIPLLAAVLLGPVIAYRLLWLRPADVSPGLLWTVFGIGVGMALTGTAYVGFDLPSAGNARLAQRWYLVFCLLPLIIAATALNTFWAWLPPGTEAVRTFDLVSRGKNHLDTIDFLVLGALMHGGGLTLGIVGAMFVHRRPPPVKGLRASLAAVATGLVGGWFAMLFTSLSNHDPATGALHMPKVYACFGFPLVMGLFLLVSTLLVGVTSYITEDEDREWWSRSGGWLSLVSLSWPIFAALVLYAGDVLHTIHAGLSAGFTALTGVTGWAASRMGRSSDTPSGRTETADRVRAVSTSQRVKEVLGRLLLPAFIAMLAIMLSAANKWLVRLLDSGAIERKVGTGPMAGFWPAALSPVGDKVAHVIWVIMFYALLCAVASWFINVNKFSLHAMYRQRLIRAYLGASNAKRDPHPFTGFDENDNVSMCNLSRCRPLHVVNMALNLVGGKNLAWQQRKAASFTSTRLHTGGCRIGYRPSSEYGGAYKPWKTPISLGTAITISGAAASPNMGYHSSALLTLVMTLFNARLGWWLGNPREGGGVWKKPGPNFGIRSFVDEAFGRTTETNAWIYLSDGGHFENLGLYEMVLRRCKLIVVSDAGADPAFTYEDLGNAVRKIRIDFGISIILEEPAIPTTPHIRGDARTATAHCATARIQYSAADGPGVEDGLLVYVKPTLTGTEPADVRQYASTDRLFPQQPTSDQFFDESQFESYRRLGYHTVEKICEAMRPGGGTVPFTLVEFVEAARKHAGAAMI